MTISRRTAITGLADIGVAACDPMADDPTREFERLEALYRQIEDSIFPGSPTPEENLPAVGGFWDGAARPAHFEDGDNFTQGVNAAVSVLADFLSRLTPTISGADIDGFVTRDGRDWPGALDIRRDGFSGNSFATRVDGTLVIDGVEAQLRGRVSGRFYGDDGRYAYGNLGFAGPDLSPRFGGTFALLRRGVPLT